MLSHGPGLCIFYTAFTGLGLSFVPIRLRPGHNPALEMTVDLLYVLATLACFALTVVLVRGLDWLRKRT
jgi:hypothetical protein